MAMVMATHLRAKLIRDPALNRIAIVTVPTPGSIIGRYFEVHSRKTAGISDIAVEKLSGFEALAPVPEWIEPYSVRPS